MVKNIINLEINEVSSTLISDFISKNKNGNLAKLLNKDNLKIYTTKALDIEKNKLYPSQTWASFNTGKSEEIIGTPEDIYSNIFIGDIHSAVLEPLMHIETFLWYGINNTSTHLKILSESI